MSGAFQTTAFQDDAFQIVSLDVTATTILQLPVDYVLHGHQPYEFTKKDAAIPAQYSKSKGMRRSHVTQLEGGKPSFTSKSGSLGGAHKD